MEWNLSSNICRCCLSQGSFKGLNLPNFWMGEEELYSVMLRECFDVTLSQSDKMSDSGICEVCITQLRNSFNFKKQVLNSEALFQARLTEHSTKVETDTEIKVEILEDHGSDNESNSDFGAERLDDLQDMEQVDMEIKYESPPEKKRGGSKRSSATLASSAPVKKSKRIKKETSAKTVASKSPGAVLGNTRTARKQSASVVDALYTHKYLVELPILYKTEEMTADEPEPKKPIVSVTNKKQDTPLKEKHRINLMTILECSNATPFKTKTCLGYICSYCNNVFNKFDDLRTHTHDEHPKEKVTHKTMGALGCYVIKLEVSNLRCTLCDVKFDELIALREHLASEHNKPFFTDVNDHIIQFRFSDSKSFTCILCSARYETFKMLHQHMNKHYRNYICKSCNAGFVNKHCLTNHEHSHQKGNLPCRHCDKVFDSITKRRLHENGAHLGSWDRNKCPQCPEKFITYYQRNIHLAKVHEVEAPWYNCEACDKTFIRKSLLTEHIKKDHLLERNHECSICKAGFYLKSGLEEHMIKHSNDKMFTCEVCEKSYARKKTLREHMRIHDNDRRFKCDICSMTFIQKCSMKSHMMTNHGLVEKPRVKKHAVKAAKSV